MNIQPPDPYRYKEDVLFVDDTYDMFVENGPFADIMDVQLEAKILTGLINSHGFNNRLLAVVHQDDRQRIAAYKSLGYTVHTMNGKRSEELIVLIADLVEKINQQPPRKLITISNNPAFSVLFSVAEQKNIDVSVWLPGEGVPNSFRPYVARRLDEILPITVRKHSVIVRLDVENHLIGLHNAGQTPDTKAYLDAIQNLIQDLGSVISVQASADWKRLREALGRDYQAEFEENNVRTVYRRNIPGKNTNDIALAGSIQEALERNPEADTFVIGTGDADFLPIVDTIHDRGKKTILIALKGSLSKPLAAAADEVRYLDSVLAIQKNAPKDPIAVTDELITAIRLAEYLRSKQWKFAYYNRLPSEFSKKSLQKAVKHGLLKHRSTSEPYTYTINTQEVIGRRVTHFVQWLHKCLHTYLVERHREFCDTKFLQNGMKYDRGCRELQIGSSLKDVVNWLSAAEQAGIVRKVTKAHPQKADMVIETWWLTEGKKALDAVNTEAGNQVSINNEGLDSVVGKNETSTLENEQLQPETDREQTPNSVHPSTPSAF